MVWSQRTKCPPLPEKFNWSEAQDYRRDSAFVVDCLIWLDRAPLYSNIACRSSVTAYVLEWLSGCPSPVLVVDSRVFPFAEQHPELFLDFLCSMALNQIRYPSKTDKVAIHSKAFADVAKHLEKEKELKKTSEMKKIIRLGLNEKKLNKYIRGIVGG
ncbi:MAG: hypothetical protein RL220_677 [Bacteroidota bacterium]|jgi:hypothetical protein